MTQQQPSSSSSTPAFRGAPFNTLGNCLFHPSVQLSQVVHLQNRRVVYKEICKSCPRCNNNSGNDSVEGDYQGSSNNSTGGQSNIGAYKKEYRMNSIGSLNKSSRSNTTTGGHSHHSGSSRGGHYQQPREKSINNSSRSGTPGRCNERRSSQGSSAGTGGGDRSRSRGLEQEEGKRRSSSRSRSRGPTTREEGRSKSRTRASSRGRGDNNSSSSRVVANKKKKEYKEAPFDSKGRCHYHSQVQLAKKKLMGGWNVLLDICPKCMEESYINDDSRSVASGRSTRSVRSNRSVRSARSTKSSSGKLFSKNKSVYESPFDSNGYCHRHSHVRLAKKKTLGGWKIIQSFCTQCAMEDNGDDNDCSDDNASARSGKSRKSTSSRVSKSSVSQQRRQQQHQRRYSSSSKRYDDDDYETTESAHSTSQSADQPKKKLVKKMKFRDQDVNGQDKEGLYSGYVNGEYQPHGRGKIVYSNGDWYEGTWCEGSRVHGKSGRGKGSVGGRSREEDGALFSSSGSHHSRSREEDRAYQREEQRNSRRMRQTDTMTSSHDGGGAKSRPSPQHSSSSSRPQQQTVKKQIEDYREMYTDVFPVILEAKKVKAMRFVDYYGDPGRYTGEVNDANMPHGMGEMTYDHGLVQGGTWTNGILDEGSIVSCPRSPRKTGACLSLAGDSSRKVNGVRDP